MESLFHLMHPLPYIIHTLLCYAVPVRPDTMAVLIILLSIVLSNTRPCLCGGEILKHQYQLLNLNGFDTAAESLGGGSVRIHPRVIF